MNDYYVFTPPLVVGSKARAGEVNNQFAAIEAAFDLLPSDTTSLSLGLATLGVESGSGNLYVVATEDVRGALVEGEEIVFKATHQNTGASTFNRDGVGAIALRRFDGTALEAADIVTGRYYAARYDLAQTQWRIVWPAQVTTVSGAITYAVPSTDVDVDVPTEGASTSVLRADAKLRLSQSIAPTMIGVWTFSNVVNFNGAVTMTAGLSTNTLTLAGTLTGPANSGGTVTLSALNGTAATWSRSDHGHVLSQSIAPTWTNPHIFSNTATFNSTTSFTGVATFTSTATGGGLVMSNATPQIAWSETTASTTNRRWDILALGEQWLFRATNDSGSSATPFITVDRTANTVDAIAFSSTAMSFNGVLTLTKTAVNAENTALVIAAAIPRYTLNQTGGATDNKFWTFTTLSEQLQFGIENDAHSVATNWLTVDRTGTTIDNVLFPVDTGNQNFTVGTIDANVNQTLAKFRTSRSSTFALMAVNNNSAVTSTMAVHNQATSGDNAFIVFLTENSGGSTRGSITYNRGGGVVAYNTTCREALKENIRPSESGIPLLRQIPIVAFDWKRSTAKLPYFVTYEKMEPLVPWACQNDGVDVSKIVPLTIKVVQELLVRIEALEAAAVNAVKVRT